ncbi:molybdenum ABC transporter ATP-binding protein [Virgibacillus profundi]|uniref:Molybdenum ABC transporter ATP-binding protein n=1 Tax=Virgibacillus profundi TaxID=2024555 RepID=A0A2A2IF32_9BACI|nr:ABC transporter ATP-binding protein [Virgibacillus profundi]PAV29693.1 molybdenum ABC transporter ATP-binding protein [Virgibacillus profundi]PXY53865.1 ABC transporter ATP-binding protein [Virgibacillus profundi]
MSDSINIEDVSWKRQTKTILSHVNWKVKTGQHWAVLGLNGSGKTTLLNIINGYIWPTTGDVRVLGKQFGKTDLRELRKSIGWVSSSLQERIKETELAENIVVSGKYASIGLYESPSEADYQKASEIMQQLGCSNLAGRTYQTCSQGERQKILIARGLMSSPELLILDEPCSGLDFIAREDLLSAITELANKENTPTIIFVTHHIEEILPIFSHTLLLRDGKVFDKGDNEQVLTGDRLSHFFSKPVQIKWHKDRPWMTLLDES